MDSLSLLHPFFIFYKVMKWGKMNTLIALFNRRDCAEPCKVSQSIGGPNLRIISIEFGDRMVTLIVSCFVSPGFKSEFESHWLWPISFTYLKATHNMFFLHFACFTLSYNLNIQLFNQGRKERH